MVTEKVIINSKLVDERKNKYLFYRCFISEQILYRHLAFVVNSSIKLYSKEENNFTISGSIILNIKYLCPIKVAQNSVQHLDYEGLLQPLLIIAWCYVQLWYQSLVALSRTYSIFLNFAKVSSHHAYQKLMI